ncbi:hypothetical protein J6590_042155 [Homalodisca vitripennis]|nr:hypothetical protein J6590_042155 [Homalodisca vitripennis]
MLASNSLLRNLFSLRRPVTRGPAHYACALGHAPRLLLNSFPAHTSRISQQRGAAAGVLLARGQAQQRQQICGQWVMADSALLTNKRAKLLALWTSGPHLLFCGGSASGGLPRN